MSRYDVIQLRRAAETAGQGHLFCFWEALPDAQREALLADVAGLDFDLLRNLLSDAASASENGLRGEEPLPVDALDYASDDAARAEANAAGLAHIKAGRVAALLVAGGQGTRLGFNGPKGLFPISPVRGVSLFQWFAETLAGSERRARVTLPWYIMTSPVNDAATREYFASRSYFGRARDSVHFFTQGTMPAVSTDGKILLEDRHRLALSPNGHGGTLTALAESGCLERMREAGVESVSYFQVDNPLARPVDPLLIGAHVLHDAEVTSLTVGKADDFERVGNFVRFGDRVHVIEYTEMPEALALRRDAAGRRVFDAANLSIFIFARTFLERITRAGGELPWHRAIKKVPYLDPRTGARVEPEKPNAIKFERFVFDALPLARRVSLLRSTREECFSPVKNATGTDSAETARRDLSRRAARWLVACGVPVPTDAEGDPRHPCEISPAVAQDPDELREALRHRPRIDAAGPICLTP